MSVKFETTFFKGPVTACEYYDADHFLIGYGPYLALFKSQTLDRITEVNALKYRVIHKIIFGPQVNETGPARYICVFGQKALNVLRLNEANKFESVLNDQYIELNDWIFDIYWLSNSDFLARQNYLVIVSAHNQATVYNMEQKAIERCVFCTQKCMLYSARIFDLSPVRSNSIDQNDFENIYVASGTVFNQVLLWSSTNGQVYAKLEAHKGVIFNISIDLENQTLFSVSDDRFICVWRFEVEEVADRPKCVRRIKGSNLHTRLYGHEARVWNCVSFKYESKKYLCSIGEDLNCCLWSLDHNTLLHRFSAMRKCTKNIWSLSMNEETLQLLTGWADGGLRRFDLKNYLSVNESKQSEEPSTTPEASCNLSCLEWNISSNQPSRSKDFVRCAVLVDDRIVYCTNLGYVYMIDERQDDKEAHCLLLQSDDLQGQYIMSKVKIASGKWILSLAASKGSMYQLTITFDEQTRPDFKCEIKRIDFTSSAASSNLTMSPGEFKICNFVWHEYNDAESNQKRFYLASCHSLVTGLVNIHELRQGDELALVARIELPECKQRWLTSLSIIDVDSESSRELDTIWLTGGDKNGNLHLYKVTTGSLDTVFKPIESIRNVTKYHSAISSVYATNKIKSFSAVTRDDASTQADVSCIIIYCCQDGFYRVFEFNSQPTLEEVDDSSNRRQPSTQMSHRYLKLVNKYQINSYIDVIEAFITENDLSRLLSREDLIRSSQAFDLEQDLSVAICFYGDRFLLWSFHLNRALLDVQCGGANRSWDLDIEINKSSGDSHAGQLSEIRFIYIKNKVVNQVKKHFDVREIRRTRDQLNNHFCQIFHGNTITTCMFLNESYLLTAGEDTQIIVTRFDQPSNNSPVSHQFHLQGHDSVVRCLDTFALNKKEVLLISGGGKADMKLWKVVLNESNIEKVIQVNEFKRIYSKKLMSSISERSTHLSADSRKTAQKPWHYIDMESNPDIRFMDVKMVEFHGDIFMCFACSDGVIRVFKYDQKTSFINLVNKYVHPKCLLCMKVFRVKSPSRRESQPYVLCAGTDGRGLLWKFKPEDTNIQPFVLENLNQSGINGLDVYQEQEESTTLTIASAGDDTRLCVVELEIKSDDDIEQKMCIRLEMAHASCIASVKFLSGSVLMTVAKDQRLVIWKLDRENGSIVALKTIFVNVADVSAMDVIKSSNFHTKVAVVGIGLEVLSVDLNSLEISSKNILQVKLR